MGVPLSCDPGPNLVSFEAEGRGTQRRRRNLMEEVRGSSPSQLQRGASGMGAPFPNLTGQPHPRQYSRGGGWENHSI